jgi:UDP-N-acetyl-D-mannosaminuronic acid dehydrogenase
LKNAHRYLQIAFAEKLYIWYRLTNIDFWALRDALNTKRNVDILEPRDGIGGHCLPKETKMFLNSSQMIKSKILSSSLEADKDYRNFKMSEARGRLTDSEIDDSIPIIP